MMNHCFFLVRLAVAVVSAAHVLAQGWSITAQTEGTSRVSVRLDNVNPPVTTSNSLPAATNVTPGFALTTSASTLSSIGNCTAEWGPSFLGQQGPLRFRVHARSNVSVSGGIPFSYVYANGDTTVLLQLNAPSPVGGRLAIVYDGDVGQMGSSAATIEIDLGADGTIELHARTLDFVFVPGPRSLELPVVVGAGGLLVRVHITGSAITNWPGNWNFAVASLYLTADFRPNQAVVQTFDWTGATASLLFEHPPNDVVTLRLGALPAIMIFGTQPMVAPVPGWPQLTQLVSIDAFVIANQLALPMPLLPAGTSLYAQGLVVDPSGSLRGSNSVRALWP